MLVMKHYRQMKTVQMLDTTNNVLSREA